jgi:hypothetical protein
MGRQQNARQLIVGAQFDEVAMFGFPVVPVGNQTRTYR